MRVGRAIRRALVVLLVALGLAAVFVYGLASRIPSDYRPARLTADQQEEQVNTFFALLGRFSEHGGAGRPFTWSVTEKDANLCLGSIDAIASFPPGEPVHPMAELEREGFADPAVAMHEGVLRLMIRSTGSKKILGVDLGFVFDDRGDVRAKILAMRVGAMPVPKILLRRKLGELREDLQELLAGAEEGESGPFGAVRTGDVARFLKVVVGMLDGAPARPEIVWDDQAAAHPLRITRVELAEGKLTLHIAPVSGTRPTGPTSPAPGGAG